MYFLAKKIIDQTKLFRYEAVLLSSLLFSAHTVHTEAISGNITKKGNRSLTSNNLRSPLRINYHICTGLVGRAEPLSLLFCLLAFFAFDKAVRLYTPNKAIWFRWFMLAMFCYIVATLCKETGYTILAILIAWDALISMDIRKSNFIVSVLTNVGTCDYTYKEIF